MGEVGLSGSRRTAMTGAGMTGVPTIMRQQLFQGQMPDDYDQNVGSAEPDDGFTRRTTRRPRHRYVTMAGMRHPQNGPRSTADPRLDDISKAIIEVLQVDGRASYAAIAKEVGLSEAAIRQRVQRLLDAGIMQIVAVTDPIQVGFRRQAMIGIRVGGDLVAVGDALTEMPEVDYVVTTAGSFDILAEVVCEDDEQLLELLSTRIRQLPGVQSTETFVYLKLNKQHYNWGTR
jgi:Lrp/AsnC family transcriptional regulator, regulator for asnA, asnC and gidA